MIAKQLAAAQALMDKARVGVDAAPELASLASEDPDLYVKAVKERSKLAEYNFGEVLDLNDPKNQKKFLTNDKAPAFTKTAKEDQKLWRNYMLDYDTTVNTWLRPNTLNKLVDGLATAGANRKPIRAIGAGHSSADVARPTKNGLVEIDNLDNLWMHPFLKDGVDGRYLRRMEAGISIRTLNRKLRSETQDFKYGLALENMGSYDEQSIIGAACTGTHGSGIGLAALTGSVASIVLVTLKRQDGKLVPRILQIEPTDGITDPAKFDAKTGGLDDGRYQPIPGLRWELVQDDRYFQAAAISLGCFGIVYAVTLKVRPSFWLEESRIVVPWRKVKATMEADMHKVRCYELLINPYPTFQEDGSLDYSTLVTKRRELPWQDEVPLTRSMGMASFADRLIADLNISEAATDIISDVFLSDKKAEERLPYQIDKVIRMLQVKGYRSWSPGVLLLGAGNSMMAWSCEAAIAVGDTSVAVDAILGLAKAKIEKDGGGLHTSPIGIRFVAPSAGLISPQGTAVGAQKRDYSKGTCMIEVPILRSKRPQQMQILKDIQSTLVPRWRTHWGQLHWLDERNGDKSPEIALDTIRKMYGDSFDTWLEVYRELNPDGMFSNDFTRRYGFDQQQHTTT